MAPMSSTIASVSRNSLRLAGTRGPSSASTPTANAMSVAIGIAQPSSPSPPTLMATNRSAGTTMPPTAATAGSAARLAVAQLAGDQLALDLEPDDEEEDGHQRVVDPVHQRLGDREVARPDGELAVPPARVARGVGVGPHMRRPRPAGARSRSPPRATRSRCRWAARPCRGRDADVTAGEPSPRRM